MEQVNGFKQALAVALAEGARRKQLRLQAFMDEHPELVQMVTATVGGAVLVAARAGELETSVVLGANHENDIAAEFLRRSGLDFTFTSRTAEDIRKYPELSGFAIKIRVAQPKEM